MNPDKTIRPWLVAVGSTWGNRNAFDYRWPDADTRQQDEYFTYKLTNASKGGELPEKAWTSTGTTLNRKSIGQWIFNVQIDLYRSQDGLAELARCAQAAFDDNTGIKKLFSKGSCALKRVVSIENLTDPPADAEGLKEHYHHRMICEFYKTIGFTSVEQNEVVNEINVTLGDWDN